MPLDCPADRQAPAVRGLERLLEKRAVPLPALVLDPGPYRDVPVAPVLPCPVRGCPGSDPGAAAGPGGGEKDSWSPNPESPPKIHSQEEKKKVTILYTNWKGDTNYRNIIPMSVEFKATQWHPEEQWILNAMDVDKNAQRAFAIKDIKEWKVN